MLFRLQNLDNGEFLALAKNGVLTVDINSTLFNDQGDLLGSFSYEGTMPLEPNRWILQNAHLITSSLDLRTFNALAYLGGIPWKKVKCNFRVNEQAIHYHLYLDATIISNQLKSLKLHELVPVGPNDQINFPDAAAYQAYMMSTISAAPGTMPMVFFPYKNDGAFKDLAPADYGTYPGFTFPLDPYINSWHRVAGVGSFKFDPPGGPYRQVHTPFFFLTYLIRQIAHFFDLTIEGKWMEEETSNRVVFFSNIMTQYPGNIGPFTFFMPDILLNAFFKEVREQRGVVIDIDFTRKVLFVESIDNLEVTDDIFDLRPFQEGYGEEKSTSQRAYRITMGADDKDTSYSDQEKQDLTVVTVGDINNATNITEIALQAVSTKMLTEISPADVSSSLWRIPYIKQPIAGSTPFDQISDRKYIDRNNFKMRFMYWHGMVQDANGYPYPYGSADNLNWNNQPIADTTLALTNTGTAFLAVKKKCEFINNTIPREFGFWCSPLDFFKITAKTQILIKDRNKALVKALFDVSSADFDNSKQKIYMKITVYPILRPSNKLQIIPAIPPSPPSPPTDNGVVFARLEVRNITHHEYSYPPPAYLTHDQDLYVTFFADAALSIPKDVTDLDLRLKVTQVTAGDLGSAIITRATYTKTSAGFEVKLYNQAPHDTNQGGTFIVWSYELETTAHYTAV